MKLLSNLKKKNLQNKICLVRIDLNIKDKDINKNNLRIQAVLPTIKFLIKNGAKVVLLSHRGRPQINTNNQQLSLKPFLKIFNNTLKKKVEFINFDKNGFVGANSVTKISASPKGSIFLLENLRFLKGEENNDVRLAKKMASLGDIYINDAFAVDHRDDASLVPITKFLPSYAGLLLEKEISNLNKVRRITQTGRGKAQKKYKKTGLIIILGGVKISDKEGVINKFKNKADFILIGGGIANNFLKAQGFNIGKSIYEEKSIGLTKKLLKNKKIILPDDYFMENNKILDVGPLTVKKYSEIIAGAKTIIWGGPMGMVSAGYKDGSIGIVKAVLKSRAFVVVGGGETATLFQTNRLAQSIKKLKQRSSTGFGLSPRGSVFVSTGGGAMLKYLSGKDLPGIKALN